MNRSSLVGLCVAGGALFCACVTEAQVAVPVGDDAYAYGEFDQTLAPYGEWISVEGHRCWRPFMNVVGPGFVPYATNGTWVNTDYGWSFDTSYPWGWATFHYGRWWDAPGYGWVWFPGRDWGSSWCEWRGGGGYVGWRPLPPEGLGVAPAFVFVDERRFVDPDPARFAVPQAYVARAQTVTRPLSAQTANGSARWYAGPPREDVARAVGRPIQPAPMSARPPPPGQVVHGPIVQARPAPNATPGATPAPGRPAPVARPAPSPEARPAPAPARPPTERPSNAARPAPAAPHEPTARPAPQRPPPQSVGRPAPAPARKPTAPARPPPKKDEPH